MVSNIGGRFVDSLFGVSLNRESMSKNLLRIATAAAFFLAFITSAPRAYAQTSCWKMLEEYWGPPQVENVKKCMSFSAVECLVVPHCCNPLTCLGFSDCYFFEETVVNDGSLICDLTDAEAFQQWLDGVIYNTVPNVLEPFIDLMRADARPLPEAWRTLVKQLRDSSVMPAGASFPSDAQIDGVSILGIDDAEAPLGWFISAANPNGVTFGDLVVLDDSDVDYILEHSPPDLNAALCGTLDAQSVRRIVSLLMHELTHVGQYYEMGRDAFYAAWTFNSTFNSNPLEAEATDVEDAFQIHAACANLSIEFPGFIEWGPVGSTTTIPVVVTNLGLVTAHPSSVRFQLPDGVVFQNSTESCIIFSELGFVDCITSPVLASGE
ncbi:MAG TPA: hypothetical protein VHO25_25095, partial [Polyangiaceae bacterium]|nr:hypothetical protein [Polyangiaceae bacterium]